MPKQVAYQRYIFKLHSGRLRKAQWNLSLPLPEARRNEEIVSLADSQVLRWLDELNGVADIDGRVWAIKHKIKEIREKSEDAQSRREIKNLYSQRPKNVVR